METLGRKRPRGSHGAGHSLGGTQAEHLASAALRWRGRVGATGGAAPLPGAQVSPYVCLLLTGTLRRTPDAGKGGDKQPPYLNADQPSRSAFKHCLAPPTSGPVVITAFHRPAPPVHSNTPELKRSEFSTNTRSWTGTQARWQRDIRPFSRKGGDRVTTVPAKLGFTA